MRLLIFLAGLILPGAVYAHVGHFGNLSGHDHWLAAAAIGAAIALVGWKKLGGRKTAQVDADADAGVDVNPPEE